MRLRESSVPIAALTALAAVFRFATLDLQSFGDAETFTVLLVRMDFGHMIAEIPRLEGTPPLYYVLAWAWGKLFGTGELGLRSLSALLSTATVPVAYAAARVLVARRAALLGAALVAVNPLLIWFAQEARAYSLLVLFSALGLLFFLRAQAALRAPGANLAWWALASALAVATHYFAVLVVVPEAAWLLWSLPRRRVLAAAVVPLAVGLALAPLAFRQSRQAGGGETELASLGLRLARIPKQFLVGFNVPGETVLTIAAVLAVATAAALLLRSRARGGVAAPAAVGGAGLVLMLLLAAAGSDYVLSRYLTLLVVPFALVAATGFALSRAGLAAAALLIAVSVTAVMGVNLEPSAQRPDYRGALDGLGPPRGGRAVVMSSLGAHYELYLPGSRGMPGPGRPVRELVVVGLVVVGGEMRKRPRPARFTVPSRGFRLSGMKRTRSYVRLRYTASRPVRVSPLPFLGRHPEADPAGMLYQPPR